MPACAFAILVCGEVGVRRLGAQTGALEVDRAFDAGVFDAGVAPSLDHSWLHVSLLNFAAVRTRLIVSLMCPKVLLQCQYLDMCAVSTSDFAALRRLRQSTGCCWLVIWRIEIITSAQLGRGCLRQGNDFFVTVAVVDDIQVVV